VPQLASRRIQSPRRQREMLGQLRVWRLVIPYVGGHSIWRVRCGAVNHAPSHPLRQLPQPLAILVKHDDHTRRGILSRIWAFVFGVTNNLHDAPDWSLPVRIIGPFLSVLKTSRCSTSRQPEHSNVCCSYPVTILVLCSATRTRRISSPHETHRIVEIHCLVASWASIIA
jgi:hypothetical protein